MTNFAIGQVVRFRVAGKKAFGTVRTEATATATGPVVSVQLLPDFAHLLPTGWTDAGTDELTAVRVCECAKLGYRPIWGDHQGELFTTGCDFSRQPSRTSKFLPGHDAKAKGFLIRASQMTATLENGKGALETAQDLGDKIAMKVAEGMDNERRKTAGRRRGNPLSHLDAVTPATREDELTQAQRLQRELGVTDAMLKLLARAVTDDLAGCLGYVSGPTGTVVALQKRGLISWGRVTTLGYQVMDQPTFAEAHPDHVTCTDDQGSYEKHVWKSTDLGWDCRRCGAQTDDL